MRKWALIEKPAQEIDSMTLINLVMWYWSHSCNFTESQFILIQNNIKDSESLNSFINLSCHYFLNFYLLNYLAGPHLNCSMWHSLWHVGTLNCGMQTQLWHAGSSSLTRDQIWDPCIHWEGGALATGSPDRF